jgi:hypothetical protein
MFLPYDIGKNEIIHSGTWAFLFSYQIAIENQRFGPIDEINGNSSLIN